MSCRKNLLLLLLVCLFICPVHVFSQATVTGSFTKLTDGVLIQLPSSSKDATRLVKLQVVSDKIIHVVATPLDSFPAFNSLMVVKKEWPLVKWDITQTGSEVTLSTALVHATVSLVSGEIHFTDNNGQPILSELKNGGRNFTPVTVEGENMYGIEQRFESPADEGLYGLGQHQTGLMNYRDYPVELAQYNTEVAVPFLLSDKGYGILWDNYSITHAVDTRSFLPLSDLKLYSAKGEPGWLTATYYNKNHPGEVMYARPESVLDYEYLQQQKNFPAEIKLGEVTVTWEGSIESGVTGMHNLLFKSAGYGKLWVDGKLLIDRWRQAWNPGSVLLKLPMEKGRRYSLKIEWNPDGGESYISCKWQPPLPDNRRNEYAVASETGTAIDYYFVYGKSMDEVISGYRSLTGKAPIVPKWAMGLWQSRERYKTQDEILKVTDEFRKRKIPLDNIVLDWSYWEQDKWGSQEFDLTRFPDAAAMIKTLHEQYNTHFMISVWPKFYEGISNYNYFNENGWLYKRNIANRQRDWIGKGYVSTFYDAFNPKAREAFWGLLNKFLYPKGIDAWWMDATEPDIYSNNTVEHRKQLMTPTALGPGAKYFNAFPLLNASAVYEGQRKADPNKRVFILTRSAYAGSQRYAAATWSGDISARWHDFKDQIAAGLNFSMSGIPYWTSDIGGFAVEHRYENAKGKELEEWREQMTRWYQFGAFCPLFRVHGQYPYREIFNVAPDNHPAYQSMLYYDKLRYRLMPYIYSLAGKTYFDNYTIMRALVMDFTNDPMVKNIGDQYMFGPSLLINPVYSFGATTRKLYLPAGNGWYDLYTGNYQNGGQSIEAAAPMERIPVFVKEGSIMVYGPDMQYSTEKPADPLTLYVYTGKDATFTLYEDENVNYNYEKGAYSKITFNYNEQTKTLTMGDREGSFAGMMQQRTLRVIWIDSKHPKPLDFGREADKVIRYKGKHISVKY